MYRDLSQPIDAGMQTFPGDPPVEISPVSSAANGVAVSELHLGTHAGTHVDAPSHVFPDGDDLDDRPIDAFVLDARFVDVSGLGPRTPIRPSALPDSIDADVLVVHTGWDEHWGTERYYDHPYLTSEAATHLAAADCGVALDALNPDPTPTDRAAESEPDGLPVHETLLGAGLPIVENLTNLEDLPETFTLYAFPMPVRGVDGAPVRAVAEGRGD